MSRDQRRSPRIDISLPVRIIIHDQAEDRTLAAGEGRINDISRHGLRLVISTPKIDKWHIFYNFQDNNQQLLLLEIMADQATDQATGRLASFKLPVRPVWFDRLLSQPQKPFQLGMEFTQTPPPEVLEWLNGLLSKLESQHHTSWWSKLFKG